MTTAIWTLVKYLPDIRLLLIAVKNEMTSEKAHFQQKQKKSVWSQVTKIKINNI